MRTLNRMMHHYDSLGMYCMSMSMLRTPVLPVWAAADRCSNVVMTMPTTSVPLTACECLCKLQMILLRLLDGSCYAVAHKIGFFQRFRIGQTMHLALCTGRYLEHHDCDLIRPLIRQLAKGSAE